VGSNRIVRVIDETGEGVPSRKRQVRHWPDSDGDKSVTGTAAAAAKKPAERPEDWNRPSPLNKLLTLLKTDQKADPKAANPVSATAAAPKSQKAKHKAAGTKARAETRAAAYSSDDGGADEDTDHSENDVGRPGQKRPTRGELDAVVADVENADMDGELSDGGHDSEDDDPENPQRQTGTPCSVLSRRGGHGE